MSVDLSKSIADKTYRKKLAGYYRDGLLNDTIPFWIKHGLDQQYGGILTCLGRRGDVLDTDKGMWQQGRFTWLFGELYNEVERNECWLEIALNGATFLDQYGTDPQDGRMWFHVTQDGQPIRKRRYSFTESFAAIAYGELAKATGSDTHALKASNAFRQFVNHSTKGCADWPKFTSTRPIINLAIPMITIATAQELRESIDLPGAETWIDQSIDIIASKHMNSELHCVLENVGVDGSFLDHFDGRLLNPGHALEAAWFVLREGKYRGDSQLIDIGCKILDWMWPIGWDEQHGGIYYFRDARGLPVSEYWHDMKFWWPQNEAIIATAYAYLATQETKYAQWHQQAHDWAFEHFSDPEYGEWFGYLHRDGSRSSDLKGNLWKGPFHLPRMQLLCWKLLEEEA